MLGTTRPRRIAILTALAVLGAGVVTGVVQAATPPDFTVTATPATTTVNATSSATWTVGAGTADGFDGNVAFTVTGAPAGVSFNAPVVDLNPATSGAATLTATLTDVVGGIYPLTITGTSGTVSHSVTVTLRVRGFTVTMTPTSRSVAPGFTTTYSISVAAVAGYTGTVTLTRSGLPALTTTTLNNTPRALTTASSAYTATLGVTPTLLQPTGTFPFSIAASSPGTPTQTLNGTLVVAPRSVSLVASPNRRIVVIGGPDPLTASYPVTVTRFFTSGTATLSLPSPLPTGVTGGFSPASTAGTTSTLTLTVSAATGVPGTYTIPIRVAVPGFTGSSSVTLVLERQGQPFTVTGPPPAAGQLSPGVSAPLDLAITNPNPVPINVTALTATVTGTSSTACGAGNYSATGYSGGPLVIPANSTRTLSDLTVPRAQWPTVTMLNLPVNQNACMGVTVNLQYSGTANGGETA